VPTGQANAPARPAGTEYHALPGGGQGSCWPEYGLAQLGTGEFPHMQALLAGAQPGGSADDPPGPPMSESSLGAQFERGLQAVLDGAAARLGIRAD
jgi:hypothetical protein